MRKINIAAIAPYEGLQNTLKAVVVQFSEQIDVDIINGNLEECVRYVHLFSTKNYDLIISRGGTAEYLHRITAIPVIEIEITAYDMLHAIKAAEQLTDSFVIIGFPKVVGVAVFLKEVLQYAYEIIEITSEEEASTVLSRLHEQKPQCFVIGDTVTTQLASRLGIPNHLITSSRKSVEKAYQDAIQYYKNLSNLCLNREVLRGILEHSDTPVIAYNAERQLYYHNLSGHRADYFPLFDFTLHCIDRLIEVGSICLIKKQSPHIFQVQGKILSLAEDTFYLFYIHYSFTKTRHDNSLVVEDFTNAEADFKILQMRSALIKSVSNIVSVVGIRKVPVHICGKSGSEIDSIAKYIHYQAVGPHVALITIHCKLLSSKSWFTLVENASSPLNAIGYSIYFKDIHLLPLEMQGILDNYISDTALCSRCLVLTSSTPSLERLYQTDNFLESLYQKITGIPLRIPPISEYPEEIPALSQVLINRYNELLGKDIIGFEQQALKYLKEHCLHYTLHQLEQVVKQFVISCDNFYISEDDVRRILNAEDLSRTQSPEVDLSKPLEEIEADIIRRVLIEEDMNQTNAAHRLGISRSTLWRKLKL